MLEIRSPREVIENELQKKLLETSGAKNLQEYVNYVNKFVQNSSLHKKKVVV